MKRILATMLTVLIIAGTALTAFAATTNLVPSIAQKECPAVVDAQLVDANGQATTLTANDIIVTPYAKKDAAAADIKAALEAAYNEVVALKNVSLINTKADLDAAAKALKSEYTAKDLVVAELFDVTLTGNYANAFATAGNTLKVTFDTTYDGATSNPIVLYRCASSGEWKMIDASKVVKAADGQYTVTFSELCPVLFLKPGSEVGVEVEPLGEKQVNTVLWISLAAVACIGIAVILPVMLKKKEA